MSKNTKLTKPDVKAGKRTVSSQIQKPVNGVTKAKLEEKSSTTTKPPKNAEGKGSKTHRIEPKTTTPSRQLPIRTSKAVTEEKKPAVTRNVAKKPSEKSKTSQLRHDEAKPRHIAQTARAAKSSRPNAVLDTYHNVTVASPPQQRKAIPEELVKRASRQENTEEKRMRSRSRTLAPEEVLVLKRESAKKRMEEQISAEAQRTPNAPVKEPVAFEVKFEEPNKLVEPANHEESDHTNYSDDFESYESDFETGSSNENDTTPPDSEDNNSNSSSEDTTDSKKFQDKHPNEDTDEESEITQNPITVIPKNKEQEHKLDSGNYEMNSRKTPKLSEISMQSSQQPFDSLETLANSEQLDSGISSYGSAHKQGRNVDAFYGGYTDFCAKPIFSARGAELMSKIQFDTLTFILFELSPINYDTYMQTYGKLDSTQSSTQTHDNLMSTECQTEINEVRTMWTQHPPQYELQKVSGWQDGFTHQNCCGEMPGEESLLESETAFQLISAFRHNEHNKFVHKELSRLRKPIDFERLNAFLLNSSILMSKILHTAQHPQDLKQPKHFEGSKTSQFSAGHVLLDTRLLNALRVVRIFSNPRHNLIVTVHESLPEADVYSADFSNLLMVWTTTDSSKPIRLLSSWSKVTRVEICNETCDIVVCGLGDGSIAMWDLRETYSFCSKLDGFLTHFAATQSVVPSWGGTEHKAKKILDLGAVVDIRSFRPTPKAIELANALATHKSIQFASLNDTGILTVWTLVETGVEERKFQPVVSSQKSKRFINNNTLSFPWTRVRLIQGAICHLRDYLESSILRSQSKFDKTMSLFENNIYSDEVLRALNENQTDLQHSQGLQGLRFTQIDTGCEHIYVCTNRNFILACSKSLKTERFRKITINDSRFLFPTALRVLTNEDFLAIGLSNGSVIILNCNQYKGLLKSSNKRSSANHSDQTPPQTTASSFELAAGKSCAIQNIIINERRSFDVENDVALARPDTSACIAMVTNQKRPFELRIFDQQLILSGSVLRKHLVQSLELSSDGWRLFALSNGEVRAYDFYLDRELQSECGAEPTQRVVDIATAKTSAEAQHLLILNKTNEVELHLLRQ